MDVLREPFAEAFEGPLSEVAGLPTGLLYAVVVTIATTAGRQAVAAVVDALRPLFGEPKSRRKGLFSDQLSYGGRVPAEVKVAKSSVRVAVGQRLRSQRVEELVHALAAVPGAADLRIQAERRVFQEPGAGRGPPIE